jgi:hypothetical protein
MLRCGQTHSPAGPRWPRPSARVRIARDEFWTLQPQGWNDARGRVVGIRPFSCQAPICAAPRKSRVISLRLLESQVTLIRDLLHRIGMRSALKLCKVPRSTEDDEAIPMDLREWSESEVEYGRKVLNSGLAGARSGREAFLNGRPLTSFLDEAVRNAVTPAALGALVGMLGSLPGYKQRAATRTLLFGLLGSAIGFGIGFAWQSRGLTTCAATRAWSNIGRVRDEHWLEDHPIDYA